MIDSSCKPKRAFIRALCMAAGLAVSFSGCIRHAEDALVEGFVTMAGEPLADVEVVFLPDPERGTSGSRATALTNSQGYYAITVDRLGRSGTAIGYHRICVNDITGLTILPVLPCWGDPPFSHGLTRVPAVYTSLQQTPLSVEVGPGRQTLDLEIHSSDE